MNFKENLTYFFDKAEKEPVVVNRKGSKFIILSEKEYIKLLEEKDNLQKCLKSALQIQNGEGSNG